MKIMSEPHGCDHVVKLLDWFDIPEGIALVMEKPSPCMNLDEYLTVHGGHLSETQVRHIFRQVVLAAQHCASRGVIHRDIKAQNLLINTDTLQVKLIDFGCSEFLLNTPRTDFFGNFIIDIG